MYDCIVLTTNGSIYIKFLREVRIWKFWKALIITNDPLSFFAKTDKSLWLTKLNQFVYNYNLNDFMAEMLEKCILIPVCDVTEETNVTLYKQKASPLQNDVTCSLSRWSP